MTSIEFWNLVEHNILSAGGNYHTFVSLLDEEEFDFQNKLYDVFSENRSKNLDYVAFLFSYSSDISTVFALQLWYLFSGKKKFLEAMQNPDKIIGIQGINNGKDLELVEAYNYYIENLSIRYELGDGIKFIDNTTNIHLPISKKEFAKVVPNTYNANWNQEIIDSMPLNKDYVHFISYKGFFKLFNVPVLIIPLGILSLFLAWKFEKGILAMVFGMLGAGIIILGLIFLSVAVDMYSKIKTPAFYEPVPKEEPVLFKYIDKILNVIGVILCYISFIVFGKFCENTIDCKQILVTNTFISISCCVFIYFVLKKIFPHFMIEKEDRMKGIFIFLLGLFFFSVLFPFYSNTTHYKESKQIKVKIDDKSIKKYISKSRSNFIHFYYKGRIRRFSVNYSDIKNLAQNDSAVVVFNKGLLNYEYLQEIKK